MEVGIFGVEDGLDNSIFGLEEGICGGESFEIDSAKSSVVWISFTFSISAGMDGIFGLEEGIFGLDEGSSGCSGLSSFSGVDSTSSFSCSSGSFDTTLGLESGSLGLDDGSFGTSGMFCSSSISFVLSAGFKSVCSLDCPSLSVPSEPSGFSLSSKEILCGLSEGTFGGIEDSIEELLLSSDVFVFDTFGLVDGTFGISVTSID
ncbi:unnamed protein product [[Candida] boidinii]|nr:unnamed protein product [[Candida] boidinii]